MDRKVAETYSDEGLECPYCGYVNFVEGESYHEDSRVHECVECEKRFHGRQSFSVSHIADPDCELNGETHEWKEGFHMDTKTGKPWGFHRCEKCRQFRSIKP